MPFLSVQEVASADRKWITRPLENRVVYIVVLIWVLGAWLLKLGVSSVSF